MKYFFLTIPLPSSGIHYSPMLISSVRIPLQKLTKEKQELFGSSIQLEREREIGTLQNWIEDNQNAFYFMHTWESLKYSTLQELLK